MQRETPCYIEGGYVLEQRLLFSKKGKGEKLPDGRTRDYAVSNNRTRFSPLTIKKLVTSARGERIRGRKLVKGKEQEGTGANANSSEKPPGQAGNPPLSGEKRRGGKNEVVEGLLGRIKKKPTLCLIGDYPTLWKEVRYL